MKMELKNVRVVHRKAGKRRETKDRETTRKTENKMADLSPQVSIIE